MSNPTRSKPLPYALVDVFAERALEGNMLAIFPDARGLSDEQMQALARETNLAETTFILPSDNPAAEVNEGIRVRIFTTQEELPFAGHPTLGTASWLYLHHATLAGRELITLRLAAGAIPVRFERPEDGSEGVYGTMRQLDPVFGAVHEPRDVAQVLDFPLDHLDPAYPVQTVSTGMPFCIVPVRSAASLAQLQIPQAAAQRWLDSHGAKFFYCVCPAEPGSTVSFRARMQFYNGEDPATGSAAGCAIAWLVKSGRVASGRLAILEQGVEIRRPSRLHVRATLQGGEISDVFVGGRTIPVASGHFFLPRS